MQVDWITVGAQLVNFLILVFLLKRFLYAPVMAMMDRRQARISEQLEKSTSRERAAAQTQQEYQQKIDSLDNMRADFVARMEHEVEAQRNELLTVMRADVARTRTQWHETLDQERERFVNELSEQSIQVMLGMTRQALTDLADEVLEERIADKFIADLQMMDSEQRELICAAGGPVFIYTAFNLEEKVRKRIVQALEFTGLAADNVEFHLNRALTCGIELVAGHARLGWNIQTHLAHLQREANEAFAHTVESAASKGRG